MSVPAAAVDPGHAGGLAVADRVWVAIAHRAALGTEQGDITSTVGLPPWLRRRRLAARGVLRSLLAQVAPDAAGAELVASDNGKPVLAGYPEVGVSMSHDDGVVAAAVAHGRIVGVDVQLPRVPLSERTLRRCLGERVRELEGLPAAERALQLAWVWSVQEACVKADGSGIGGKPWTIDVPLRPHAGRASPLHWVAVRRHCDVPVSCAFGAG